jgi:alkanesulfonate monooxygenase SsuD/methylene tetrahydromethanopterin reductase-like flavin-dependent oxidoreductase (luciferase family)
VDGGGLLLRWQVLAVRGRGDLAAAGTAAETSGLGSVSGSKETIEWAGKHDIPITPGLVPTKGLREDIIRYYARCLAQHGHRLTPDHLIVQASAYVADSKAEAITEAAPYTLYFNQTLFSHGNISEASRQRDAGYLTDTSFDYVRPENLPAVSGARERFRDMTIETIARDAEQMPWGTPDEVIARIVEAADHAGAATVLVNMNRGAMPQEMFLHQIERFGREVLPALKKHTPKPTAFL